MAARNASCKADHVLVVIHANSVCFLLFTESDYAHLGLG